MKPVLKRHGIEMKREELLKLYSQIEPKLEKKYIPYRFVLKKVAENIFKVYSIALRQKVKNKKF
ncbi:MAG: hypothetical protein J7L34_07060 [Thermotogaceae bacterium]|nr:hypothetical protein [Thermotogaceae bacterium]